MTAHTLDVLYKNNEAYYYNDSDPGGRCSRSRFSKLVAIVKLTQTDMSEAGRQVSPGSASCRNCCACC